MKNVADKLDIDKKVLESAKQKFSIYRDSKENVYHFEATCGASIILAAMEMIEQEKSVYVVKEDKKRTFNERYPFVCNFCSQRFSVQRDLIVHKPTCNTSETNGNVGESVFISSRKRRRISYSSSSDEDEGDSDSD